MINNGLYLWLVLGSFWLIWLTVQDYRRMIVDDRRNFFMLGLTVMLYSWFHHLLWYLFVVLAAIYGWSYFAGRLRAFAAGDLSAINWVFLGYAIVGPFKFVAFSVLFAAFSLVFVLLKNFVLRYKQPLPFYGVVLTAWFAGLIFILL